MKRLLNILFLSLVTTCGYAQIKDGLVARYLFNGNANDIGPYKQKGTFRGEAKYVTDHNNESFSALNFKGNEGAYMQTDNFKGLNNKAFSFALWYKNVSKAPEYGLIASATKPKSEWWLFTIDQRKHKTHPNDSIGIFFYVYKKDNRRPVYYFTYLDKKWHHIGLTAKVNGEFRVYIDGKRIATRPVDADQLCFVPNLFRVGHYDDTFHNAEGVFDDVQVFNRQLSDGELYTLYKGKQTAMPESLYETKFMKAGDTFSTKKSGKKLTYTLPSKLKYIDHKFTEYRLGIHYSEQGASYIGIWNDGLEYVAQYNFKGLAVKGFALQAKENGNTLVHYHDPAHKTAFAGIFDSKMQYLGQYELTGATDIQLAYQGINPTVSYMWKGKKYIVELRTNGTAKKKTIIEENKTLGR